MTCNFRNPEYLWIAKEIAKPGSKYIEISQFNHQFWCFRVHRIWSIILQEKSIELKIIMDNFVKSFRKKNLCFLVKNLKFGSAKFTNRNFY